MSVVDGSLNLQSLEVQYFSQGRNSGEERLTDGERNRLAFTESDSNAMSAISSNNSASSRKARQGSTKIVVEDARSTVVGPTVFEMYNK